MFVSASPIASVIWVGVASPCGDHGDAVASTTGRAERCETVPGYEVAGVEGMGAPKGTPPETIERLNGQINAGLT